MTAIPSSFQTTIVPTQFAMLYGGAMLTDAYRQAPKSTQQVFAFLCLHARKGRRSWTISVARLAAEAGMSTRSVQRGIRDAVKRGLISVRRNYAPSGAEMWSTYTVCSHVLLPSPELCEHCGSPFHSSAEHDPARHQPCLGKKRGQAPPEEPAQESFASGGGGANPVGGGGANPVAPKQRPRKTEIATPLTPQPQPVDNSGAEPEPQARDLSAVGSPEPHALEPTGEETLQPLPSSALGEDESSQQAVPAPSSQAQGEQADKSRELVLPPEETSPPEPEPEPQGEQADEPPQRATTGESPNPKPTSQGQLEVQNQQAQEPKTPRKKNKKRRSRRAGWDEDQVRLCLEALTNAHNTNPDGCWWERASTAEHGLVDIMHTMMLRQSKPQLDHFSGQEVVHYRGSCRRRTIPASLQEAYRRHIVSSEP